MRPKNSNPIINCLNAVGEDFQYENFSSNEVAGLIAVNAFRCSLIMNVNSTLNIAGINAIRKSVL